jgi:hypothetical protein
MKQLSLYILLATLIIVVGQRLQAQSISNTNKRFLVQKEDSLKVLADSMINATDAGKRFRSDSQFVKTFVRALLTSNSFYYPFDSLLTVSHLYAPDSSFRIFSWQLKKDDYFYYQKGAIQVRTTNGTLKLYPLFDASMFTAKPLDSVRKTDKWIGAIYYKIIQKKYNGKNYYTLLGFDDFSESSNRKWLEVLHFDTETGVPLFGGPFVTFKDDTAKIKPVYHRFNIEYKKEARTTFNYSPELDMIVYDHLISETDQPERKQSYIPDGDFEGFKWQNGQWVHVEKVFNYTPPANFDPMLGNAPAEQAIFDNKGNKAENKLMEQSIKNLENSKKKEEEKKTPPKKKPGSKN